MAYISASFTISAPGSALLSFLSKKNPEKDISCRYSGRLFLVRDAATLEDFDVGEAVLDEDLRPQGGLPAQRTRHKDRRVLREVRDLRVLELVEGAVRLEEERAQRRVVRALNGVRTRVLHVEEERRGLGEEDLRRRRRQEVRLPDRLLRRRQTIHEARHDS